MLRSISLASFVKKRLTSIRYTVCFATPAEQASFGYFRYIALSGHRRQDKRRGENKTLQCINALWYTMITWKHDDWRTVRFSGRFSRKWTIFGPYSVAKRRSSSILLLGKLPSSQHWRRTGARRGIFPIRSLIKIQHWCGSRREKCQIWNKEHEIP